MKTCGERNRGIIHLHKQGLSTKEIVAKTGETMYTVTKVKALWKAHGDIIFESKRIANARVKDKMDMIKDLDEHGYTKHDIAEMTGVSISSVYRALLDMRNTSEEVRRETVAADYMIGLVSKRDLIRVGDHIVFSRDGRRVVAVVTWKSKYTLTCEEDHGRYKEIHSPQYQDVEMWYD